MAYNYEDNINTLNNDETKFNNDNYVYNDSKYNSNNRINDNIVHSHWNKARNNECKHYYKKSFNNKKANFNFDQKDSDRWIEINKEKKNHTVKSINNFEDFKNCTKNPFDAFNKVKVNEGEINFGNLNNFDQNIDKIKQQSETTDKEISKHKECTNKISKEIEDKENNECIIDTCIKNKGINDKDNKKNTKEKDNDNGFSNKNEWSNGEKFIRDRFNIIETRSNGNCMFEALLGTFNIERSNENVRKIREIICDSIEYNLASNLTFQADLAGMNLTLEQYLDNMRKDRTWGANTELTAFIKRFTVELCVINYEEETNRILNINIP